MDIQPLLLSMNRYVAKRNWLALEREYRVVCQSFAGAPRANEIAAVSTSTYEKSLRTIATKAQVRSSKLKCAAVYFEYDLDNEWQGNFFLCDKYLVARAEDDDWACDYSAVVGGPKFSRFAKLYDSEYDRSKVAAGTTLYLVARTLAAFGRATADVDFGKCALCIAFHDQDPLVRMREVRRSTAPSLAAANGDCYFEIEEKESKAFGIARFPEEVDVLLEPQDVAKRSKKVRLTLTDGGFADYLINDLGWQLCSTKMRKIIDAAHTPNDILNWAPVEVWRGRKRQAYHALYFSSYESLTKLIDKKRSLWIGKDYLAVPVLRRSVAAKHAVFGVQPNHTRWIVSDSIRHKLLKAKCTGIEFKQVKVVE